MASVSKSKALAKRSADTALMPPPPRPKRIKRPAKVLDEDSYTDALSNIIARDFFPGLVETESQQEYLNALDSHDDAWITAAGQKLSEVMTPGPDGRRLRGRRGTSMTPSPGLFGRGGETPKGWGGDTPMSVVSTASTATSQTEKPEVDTNMSLSAFQTKYTSEDNESFYKLLDKQNLKRAEKHAWMWSGNKIPSARQIAHRQRSERLLEAKAAQARANGDKVLPAIEAPDTRKAMPDAWPSRPDNPLMFAPSSLEDSHQTTHQRAEETSRAPPKAVIYDNTRLSAPHSPPPPNIPPSPSLSAIQAALSGRPRATASDPGAPGSATPRVAGYAFVDSAPSPSGSDLGGGGFEASSESLLGPGDATPNPFKIRERSRREELLHRMVERVARNKRVGRRDLLPAATPALVPRFASSPVVGGRGRGGLTPAGRRLLGRVAATSGVGSGSGLREGWTPRGG